VSKEEIEEKILEILRKNKDKLYTKTSLAKELNISVATALKYIDILEAKGKVKIENVGNSDVVRLVDEVQNQ
jgi:predicted transcriptional regulator